ncbi:hypothetical protein GLOTRDRAFT_119784 [Gloeophyllum trabeum ATCC 11539]|uniref:Uncharacterized protein n=1 Tax=Gloeophyllum trabeum (strain ATCC 11539 / FP-39264 / Madison 617) TaxID=670483 RepID=S7QCY6_GLOTA|nr:uncharacterized protein GLOTRDRAFT_119784 [Gloeophyllum trabeum ATCC 11539]EPQ57731.1 hypothetical protein GLOTRDRAFT_119784 [Gloeophyllum trabeum ATCC 11539]
MHRQRTLSQKTASSSSSGHPLNASTPWNASTRPSRARVTSLSSLPEFAKALINPRKSFLPSVSSLSTSPRAHASNAPTPPTPSSVAIYLLLTRILPPEIVIPILNFSGHYHRLSAHRRLETVVSARGLSVNERERRRKVYLDVEVAGTKPIRKIVWALRMPSLLNGVRMRAGGNGVWVGTGGQRTRDVHPFEVSLYRRSSPSCSAVEHSSPSPESPAYAEIIRVPLTIPVPAQSKTRYIVTWSADHELVRSIKTGDRIKLVLPAVYGRERGDMYSGEWMAGEGGFVRGEIWEAECFVYEEW